MSLACGWLPRTCGKSYSNRDNHIYRSGDKMFIVFDGPDGSGKSTLSKALVNTLCAKGINALYTWEPTDTSDASREVRRYLSGSGPVDPHVLSDLFTKDREEHVASVILPHLLQNDVVICDRYKYSALVYQRSQGVDPDYLVQCNASFPVPDIAFIMLPSSADTLMDRIAMRGKTEEYFEKKSFLSSAICMYRELPEFFPNEKFVFLNADMPIERNLDVVCFFLPEW